MPAALLRMPFHAQLQFRIVLQPPALRVQHHEPLCFHGMRFTKPVCVVISRMRHGVLLGSDTDSLALTRRDPLRFRLRPTGEPWRGLRSCLQQRLSPATLQHDEMETPWPIREIPTKNHRSRRPAACPSLRSRSRSPIGSPTKPRRPIRTKPATLPPIFGLPYPTGSTFSARVAACLSPDEHLLPEQASVLRVHMPLAGMGVAKWI